MAARLFQTAAGLIGAAVCQQHGDGHLDAAAGCVNGAPRFGAGHAGGVDDDIFGAGVQFFVVLHHIDHQVLVGFAGPHHRRRRDHVEDQFLRCARLEPGGASQDLGTDFHLDGEVRRPADLTAGVAGDGRGAAADAPGISKPAQHIRVRPDAAMPITTSFAFRP